jgi:tyrosinase
MQAPVTFTVPLSGSLTALRASNLLSADAPLSIRVVPEKSAMPRTAKAHDMSTPAEVVSIVVEAQ